MKPAILLTGKNGQVGRELAMLLPRLGRVTAVDKDEVEFTNEESIREAVRSTAPQIIVNAAAYTDVNGAESQESLATCINSSAVQVIAEEAAKCSALVVHYSTDYVFDGTRTSPYVETDSPNPVNAYGRSKLAGEEALLRSEIPFIIFRTSWVYGVQGRNFLLSILRLASEREELRIVSDQIGAPTWSRLIAAATFKVLGGLVEHGNGLFGAAEARGLYHLTAGEETSWFGFGCAIIEELARIDRASAWIANSTGGKPLKARRIIPVSSEQFPSPARRPAYSVLSNEKFVRTFGFCLPGWREQLRMAVRDLPVDEVLSSLKKALPC